MSKVLQLFSCSVSLCDTIQLNTIDENRVQGLGVLSGRTGSRIIWPLRLLERHSQVAHTGFYTQCGTGLDNGKKRGEYTLVFTHNAAECREPHEEILINLYTVWRTCVHVFPLDCPRSGPGPVRALFADPRPGPQVQVQSFSDLDLDLYWTWTWTWVLQCTD